MFGLTENEYKQIIDVLKAHGVSHCIIFGSRAKGCNKKTSDIDLAIVGDERLISYYLNEETTLPYFFDVINIEKIKNKKLLEHIERVGVKIL